MRQVTFSRTRTFHFEAVRALWSAPFNGADFGEVAATMARVRPGDFGSWHAQWWCLARTVHERGLRLSGVSRGKALLRASNYARAAEFYLAPADAARARTGQACRDWFDAGLQALDVDAVRHRIPCGGAELETVFLRSPVSGARDVLVVHGGFDSTLEELYFTIGAGAVERGYHVLLFEGPGQGSVLRESGMPFTPAWEEPAAAAIDSLTEYCDPGAVIGAGVSFGGHLLARAASAEKRYDGIVLFDYFPPMLQALAHQLPRVMRGQVTRMPFWLRAVIEGSARLNPELRWALRNAHWAFGTSTLPQLVSELARYDDQEWASRIVADVLVLLGEDEHFFNPQLGHGFARRLTGARSVTVHEFPGADGGGLHCQNGAVHQAHEVIFDWADIVTRRARTRP